MESARQYTKKIRTMSISLAFCFIIIFMRLLYLQILHNHNFFALSVKNFLRTESIASPRGNIVDCNGVLLATNRPITSLFWRGTGAQSLTSKQLMVLETIESIVGPADRSKILRAEQRSSTILLAQDISFVQLSKIIELFPNNSNIHFSTHFKRYYPNQKLASHILGHLSSLNNFETMGKMGLEKILHDTLQGQQGQLVKTINSLGISTRQEEIKTALPGQDIKITLDLPLQKLAEDLFPEGYNGALILMDPKTGALRAVTSRPNFDPSLFLDPIAQPDWNLLQHGNPFLNRAFNACYPPASIFKLITVSAALENNSVTEDNTISCCGYFRFKGRRHYCMRRSGHGILSIQDAVAKSCNILFYDIATRLPITVLADYAERFGLGKKTNLIFPEQDGLVPSPLWKLSTKGERWWPGETLSCSIGQSYLLVTPVQIACMISSIFEGYLVAPRILESEPLTYSPLDISASTRKFLRKSMKSAVQVGTGREVSKIEDIKVFAKTGTAQVVELSYKNDPNEPKAHSWFVAYFKYKNHDPLTLVIVLEHTGNSRPSKLFAKKFLMHYRAHMKNNLKAA